MYKALILNTNNQYFYHLLLLTCVLACHTLQKVFSFGLQSQLLFFLVLTLSIGVFHGMLDIVLLKNKPFSHKRFLLVYGTIAAVTCALFSLFFGLAIIFLLALSVWHFGEQQGEKSNIKQSVLRRFALGTSALAATFLLGGSDISVILTALLNDTVWLNISWLNLTWQSWRWLSYCWLFLFGFYALTKLYKRQFFDADIAEIAVVWLAFLLLPPLLAFSLYFAMYHALRHIRDVLPNKTAIKTHQTALTLTALASAFMLGCVLWQFSRQNMPIFTSQAILQATIVLLVAITLPHAILISFWRNNIQEQYSR